MNVIILLLFVSTEYSYFSAAAATHLSFLHIEKMGFFYIGDKYLPGNIFGIRTIFKVCLSQPQNAVAVCLNYFCNFV